MLKIEINCDACNKDLRHTSYSYEYYLCLSSISKKNNSGVCYAMGIPSDIKEDMHFCGLTCLKKWMETKNV